MIRMPKIGWPTPSGFGPVGSVLSNKPDLLCSPIAPAKPLGFRPIGWVAFREIIRDMVTLRTSVGFAFGGTPGGSPVASPDESPVARVMAAFARTMSPVIDLWPTGSHRRIQTAS